MKCYLLLDGCNPEPWTAPQGAIGRRGGKPFVMMHKSAQLDTYQKTVAEAVADILPDDFVPFIEELVLDVWFWRRLDSYKSEAGKTVTKHRADRSNLLKAFEDALQGVAMEKDAPKVGCVYINDVQIVSGETSIVEQTKTVDPMIFVRLESAFRRGLILPEQDWIDVFAEMTGTGRAFLSFDD